MATETHYLVPSNVVALITGVRMATLAEGVTTLHYVDGSTESARLGCEHRFGEDVAEPPDFFGVVSAVQSAARGGAA